jgi:Ca2+-binding RTX toxin-like protein
VTATSLTFAAAGEANHVIVVRDPRGSRIVDLGAPIAAGPGCVAVSANEVLCAATFFLRTTVTVGDLNDFVLFAGGSNRTTLHRGAGNDALNSVMDFVFLVGGPGDDTLDGGGGAERFRGGLGDDVMRGRGGSDTADYSERTAGVTVDLDGVADDGEPSKADTLSGIETVVGGAGNDRLTGNASFNSLIGRDGADTLVGLEGEDLLGGGAGTDRLSGGATFDFLAAGSGDDRVYGGGGSDFMSGQLSIDILRGGLGRDDMSGGRGADTFFARDRTRDRLLGGTGTDAAEIDQGLDRLREIELLF